MATPLPPPDQPLPQREAGPALTARQVRDLVAVVLLVAGMGALVAAAALYSLPAALATAGVLAIASGLFLAYDGRG